MDFVTERGSQPGNVRQMSNGALTSTYNVPGTKFGFKQPRKHFARERNRLQIYATHTETRMPNLGENCSVQMFLNIDGKR